MDIIHCLPRWRIHLTVSRIEFQSFFVFNKWFALDGYFCFHVSCFLGQLCARNLVNLFARPRILKLRRHYEQLFMGMIKNSLKFIQSYRQVTKLLANKLKTEVKKLGPFCSHSVIYLTFLFLNGNLEGRRSGENNGTCR